MYRPHAFAIASCLVCAAVASFASDSTPFVHIQADRPAYRLGETIWLRAHTAAPEPLVVELRQADGRPVAEASLQPKSSSAPLLAGRLLVPEEIDGGRFWIVARRGEEQLHALPIEVYDLDAPPLDLALTVLGEAHAPGRTVAASFRALDLDGRPVADARVEYLAVFGSVRLRGSAGITDAEGRALVRFDLPSDVSLSGTLAVGVDVPRRECAVAQPVEVARGIGGVEAFPEGGTIIPGHSQRLGLLVTDPLGAPCASAGRVVDGAGETVDTFTTDRSGLAIVEVPYERAESYGVVFDRPSGSDRLHSLPGPTGHTHALFVQGGGGSLGITVHALEGASNDGLDVVLLAADGRTILDRAVLVEGSRSTDLYAQLNAPPDVFGPGSVLLRREKRGFARRTVLVREPASVEVRVAPLGRLVASSRVAFEVQTTHAGVPVPADVALSFFQGDAPHASDIVRRSWVAAAGCGALGELPDMGPRRPGADPLGEDERARFDTVAGTVRDAFLLVYGAYSYPEEGVELDEDGAPAPESGRRRIVATPLRQPAGAASSVTVSPPGRTVVRAQGLERKLQRAHFTRSVRPVATEHAYELRVPVRELLADRSLGRLAKSPPQKRGVGRSRVDARSTLLWSSQVRTEESGIAVVEFELNDVIQPVRWEAQGFDREATRPASGGGLEKPSAGFATAFDAPRHLRVGDVFDVMVDIDVADGGDAPIDVEVITSPCVRPLLRTTLRFDPRKDSTLHRFRYEVVEPAERAELRVLAARRGAPYREVHVREFSASAPGLELTFGRSGQMVGTDVFQLRVPDDALAGSVRVHAAVSPGASSHAVQGFSELLQRPSGCFEQFTSKNYVNLVVLEALRRQATDPETMESAYRFAREGWSRLERHRRSDGGFSLFEEGDAAVQPTVVSIRQLALYERVLDGLGRGELETAVRWLEGHELSPVELMYVTLSLHESGRLWKGSDRILELTPKSAYETALLAGCLVSWPTAGGSSRKESEAAVERRERLSARQLRALEKLLDGIGSADGLGGRGVMGSSGDQLVVETLALAAVALADAGRPHAARRCVAELSRRDAFQHGTQAVVLSVRAYGRVLPPMEEGSVEVCYRPPSGAVERVLASGVLLAPLRFETPLTLDAGETASVSLAIDGTSAWPYRVGCTYRSTRPRSSRNAPFRITTRLTPSVDLGSRVQLDILIEPRGRAPESQVVAVVPIPGGLLVDSGDVRRALQRSVVDHCELQGDAINLYWDRTLDHPSRLSLRLRARVAGSFTSGPAVVYPYYESGREDYAEPLRLNVVNTFGESVDLEEAAQRLRRSAR